ncbi:MAG: hypothetical protein AVDCRST_MAG59-3862 [uncultured Thermomicrobiales bacterium]|uniref:Uncharacterized protein n=1 Tax=uncultured Thermomicrobiales bacterium TaxID=1645740 RepID=A0A6J4VBB1_9BACT|nr:MAG: hypothetical protein AVDCRST_MAG59-3862 [uncultured Thermomicrobiales bacterium]
MGRKEWRSLVGRTSRWLGATRIATNPGHARDETRPLDPSVNRGCHR